MGEPIRAITVTSSDTRTAADDSGGARLRELLGEAGWTLGEHHIVREDRELLRNKLLELGARDDVDVIVTTGGTGLGPRDNTVAVVSALVDREMLGFGEAFRRRSWEQVGPRSMLSNATAGTLGAKLVFALPGSPKALELAVRELIVPIAGHALAVASGTARHAESHTTTSKGA